MPTDEMLAGEAALSAIAAVRDACVADDGVDPLDEAAALRLAHHGLTGIGAWVTVDGFALRRGAEVEVAVTPARRSNGLGARLATLATADPGPLSAWSHGDHPAATRIAARLGFTRSRELWVMRRPAADPLPPAEPPTGVRIRAFDHEDAGDLLRVNREAFADHPEQGALDQEGLAVRMAEPWFDPAGLLLATDDDELLGFHWTKQHDEHTGEVYVVGVSPRAQGRGLGRLLTLAGLHHLAAREVAEVLLYVESDNLPARHLYEQIGFTHAATDTHVQYRRAGADGAGGRNPGLGR